MELALVEGGEAMDEDEIFTLIETTFNALSCYVNPRNPPHGRYTYWLDRDPAALGAWLIEQAEKLEKEESE